MSEEKYLFSKPFGPTERDWGEIRHGTDEATCELCGKHWSAEEVGYTIIVSRFLGRQVVEACCGRVLDVVFMERGYDITLEFIKNYAENPSHGGYAMFVDVLSDCLKKAKNNLQENLKKVKEAENDLVFLKESSD